MPEIRGQPHLLPCQGYPWHQNPPATLLQKKYRKLLCLQCLSLHLVNSKLLFIL